MRFAILSDIHGNVWALQAVLDDANQRGITQFINLGDILYGPLQPRQTFDLLQSLDVVTIQGNEDRIIYEDNQSPSPTLTYTINELGAEAIEWLRTLPTTQTIADEIFLCHGTPDNDCVYLLEDVTTGLPVVRAEAEIVAHLEGVSLPVVLCGHSHIPRVVQLSSETLVVNPGSVGVPAYDDDLPNYHKMQNYSALASYAILEKRLNGWHIELLKVPYNASLAAMAAQKQGRFDWAKWIATGRV